MHRTAMSAAETPAEKPCTAQAVSADGDADRAAVPSVMIER